MYVREFPVTLGVRDEGDGRTLFGRIVPYGETITFVDQYDRDRVKRERFLMGSLARQTNQGAWGRVMLCFEHLDGFTNTLGYGRALEERDDGAYSTFRLYTRDADKAREMVAESHRFLSVEFDNLEDRLAPDGVIERVKARIWRVAITPDPAYTRAEVLAVRHAQRPPETVEPSQPTPHLDALRAELDRLRRGHAV